MPSRDDRRAPDEPAARSLWRPLLRRWPRLLLGAALLLAAAGLSLALPWCLRLVVDALGSADPVAGIEGVLPWLGGLALGLWAARTGSRMLVLRAARAAELDLRNALVERLLALGEEFHARHRAGELLARLGGDVYVVHNAWSLGLLCLVDTVAMLTLALVLLLPIDTRLVVWALLPHPLLVVLGTWLGRRIHVHGKALQQELGTLCADVQEGLAGITTIEVHELSAHHVQRVAAAAEQIQARSVSLAALRGGAEPLLVALASSSVVVVLWLGGTAHVEGRLGLGALVQLLTGVGLLVWPLLTLGWAIALVQRGRGAWARLHAVLAAPLPRAGESRPSLAPAAAHAVEVQSLCLELDGRRVLDRVSLRCPEGSTTAIVGPTGAGKSLLLAALVGEVVPTSGTVRLDGIDAAALDEASVRRAIGYAPQEPFLFSDTIAANVAYGIEARERLPAAVVAARVDCAIRAVGLLDDPTLPEGPRTRVGERGVTLSGGQRQRVALARALVAARPVLVLDDALSAVDPRAAESILDALAAATTGRTVLVVSHRVAAIRRADRIVVLDEGRVVEQGTHATLLARGGTYAALYRRELASPLAEVAS